jgi:lipopolysaccharide transport system ATP-binding protein
MAKVIKAENISKAYQLGEFTTGTISRDIERWWALLRGKEDPFLKVGETNDRTTKGKSSVIWSLKDIDFEVEEGDVVGIIGRNGAGKSTLLKVLSRVTSPTTGVVKIKGRIASLLEVGTGFHPELTGRENIFLNGAILGMRKFEIKKKFDEIVEFAGVERYIDTPVKRYSSGMYVRLAFAVAANLEAEILVVDEVLAVGDIEFQKKCMRKMGDVSRNEGRTILFVSHNLSALSALCNKGIMLNTGQIVSNGEVDEVVKAYLAINKSTSPARLLFTGEEPERFGEKRFGIWKSLTLMNGEDQVTNMFVMGEKLKIQLELDVLKPSDDFEIGIGIGNYQQVFSHYLVSPWEGFTVIEQKGKVLLEVELPQINLFPGDYLLNIWIAIRGAYYDDAIHNAINFTVHEGKVNEHATYFERFSKNTQVYTPSTWKIIS